MAVPKTMTGAVVLALAVGACGEPAAGPNSELTCLDYESLTDSEKVSAVTELGNDLNWAGADTPAGLTLVGLICDLQPESTVAHVISQVVSGGTIDSGATLTPAASAPVPAEYDDFRLQTTACGAAAPDEVQPQEFAAPEDLGLDPTSTVAVSIVTSCGVIGVELDPALAPATVNSFVFLAQAGYFDGTVSHRIVSGFVLQAGDPTATGSGGPGYTIPDEFPSSDFVYERGTLAMANAGSGTTGSQFFIMLEVGNLPPNFSVFGRVVSGFGVLDVIAGTIPLGANARGEQSVPLETLYLETVTVEGP